MTSIGLAADGYISWNLCLYAVNLLNGISLFLRPSLFYRGNKETNVQKKNLRSMQVVYLYFFLELHKHSILSSTPIWSWNE